MSRGTSTSRSYIRSRSLFHGTPSRSSANQARAITAGTTPGVWAIRPSWSSTSTVVLASAKSGICDIGAIQRTAKCERPRSSARGVEHARDEAVDVRLVDPAHDDDEVVLGIDPDDVAAGAARSEGRLGSARELAAPRVEPRQEPVLRIQGARPAHLGDPFRRKQRAAVPPSPLREE